VDSPRTRLIVAILALGMALAGAPALGGERVRVVAVLPLGGVDAEEIATVRKAIESLYGFEVKVMNREEPPRSAWYEPRSRYRAERLLDWLRPRLPEGADRIVALTDKDISTTKDPYPDFGICGLADMDGPAAVVSTFRIKRKLGDLAGEARHAAILRRLADLARHELGHTLGLPHCPTRGCVMEDANGTVTAFERSTGDLCDQCRARLGLPAGRSVAIPGQER
jgi:archaemetzincin